MGFLSEPLALRILSWYSTIAPLGPGKAKPGIPVIHYYSTQKHLIALDSASWISLLVPGFEIRLLPAFIFG